MKNIINYFYNLNIDNLRMINDDYYFSYNNKNFIFQRVKDLYFDYQAILELNKLLIENSKPFFQIIINKNNQVMTTISDKNYILMLDNNISDKIFNFYDILDTNIVISKDNKIINRLNRTNWINMWQSKIDYFESFVNHNINKYLKLNKYANYFVGMGENAILYAKNTLDEEKNIMYDNLVVAHRRINNNSLKQLYNPLYLVIDHPSRDISEYLKMSFFTNSNTAIENYLSSVNFSKYGARLIMARMLFPSYFFDLFENLLEDNATEDDILRLVDKINDYEKYLLRIYNILKIKYNIPEINWIKKVDYSSTLTTPNTFGTSFINIDSIPSLSVTSIMLQ